MPGDKIKPYKHRLLHETKEGQHEHLLSEGEIVHSAEFKAEESTARFEYTIGLFKHLVDVSAVPNSKGYSVHVKLIVLKREALGISLNPVY